MWLAPNSGFVGESHRLKAEIIDDGNEPCFLCDDPECQEWATLHSAPDENGKRYMLCHVSECQMFDEPQKPGSVLV